MSEIRRSSILAGANLFEALLSRAVLLGATMIRADLTRADLGWPSYQEAINIGFVLFYLGLIGGSRAWWEQQLWSVLAIAVAYRGVADWRRRAGPKH